MLELARNVFEKAWTQRKDLSASEARRLKQRSSQIEKEISNLIERAVQTDSEHIAKAYERKISELHSEAANLAANMDKLGEPARPFQEMFELAMTFLASPCKLWGNGSYEHKRIVLRLVFSEPVRFSRKEGVRTPETTFPFKAIRFLQTTGAGMVEPIGIEPTTSSLRTTRSPN